MPPSRAPNVPKASPEKSVFSPAHHVTIVSGAVHHRDQVERKHLAAAQVERVALLDLDRASGDAVEPADHLERLGVADDFEVGVEAAQRRDRRRMVGLHVVDDQIVDLPVADRFADIGFETAAESLLDGVDQRDLFAHDQIGVVRHADRKRPEGFEARGGAVVDPDVVDAGTYFGNCHNCFLFVWRQNYEKNRHLRNILPLSEKEAAPGSGTASVRIAAGVISGTTSWSRCRPPAERCH